MSRQIPRGGTGVQFRSAQKGAIISVTSVEVRMELERWRHLGHGQSSYRRPLKFKFFTSISGEWVRVIQSGLLVRKTTPATHYREDRMQGGGI